MIVGVQNLIGKRFHLQLIQKLKVFLLLFPQAYCVFVAVHFVL